MHTIFLILLLLINSKIRLYDAFNIRIGTALDKNDRIAIKQKFHQGNKQVRYKINVMQYVSRR